MSFAYDDECDYKYCKIAKHYTVCLWATLQLVLYSLFWSASCFKYSCLMLIVFHFSMSCFNFLSLHDTLIIYWHLIQINAIKFLILKLWKLKNSMEFPLLGIFELKQNKSESSRQKCLRAGKQREYLEDLFMLCLFTNLLSCSRTLLWNIWDNVSTKLNQS